MPVLTSDADLTTEAQCLEWNMDLAFQENSSSGNILTKRAHITYIYSSALHI